MEKTEFDKKMEDLKVEIFKKTGQPIDDYFLTVLSGFMLETESLKETINNKINIKERAFYFDGPKTAARFGFGYGFGKYGLVLTTLGLGFIYYCFINLNKKDVPKNLISNSKHFSISKKFVTISKDSVFIAK